MDERTQVSMWCQPHVIVALKLFFYQRTSRFHVCFIVVSQSGKLLNIFLYQPLLSVLELQGNRLVHLEADYIS